MAQSKADARASSKGDGLQTSNDGRYILVPMPESDEKALPRPAPMLSNTFRAMVSGGKNARPLSTRLVSTIGLQTGAGANCYSVTNLYTDLIALGEYTSALALFREFRITRVKFNFLPYTPYKVEAAINTSGRPIAFAVDPQNASTPSSFLQVFENANAVCCVSQDTHRWTWKNADKIWYSTASTSNPLQPALSFKAAMDSSAGVSIPVGAVACEYFVEFRARL